jgi:hypothetical protein
MIKLADGTTIDRNGLKFQPSTDLLFLFVRPSGEEGGQQGTRMGHRVGVLVLGQDWN